MSAEQAIWQTVTFAAILIGGVLLIVIAYFERKTQGEWRRRTLQRGRSGEITQIGGRAVPKTLQVRGNGTFATNVSLERGRYKLSYQFGVLSAVKLIEARTGEEILMLAKTGTGESELLVENAGRYVMEIDPTEGSAASEVILSPMGLPSRRGVEPLDDR